MLLLILHDYGDKILTKYIMINKTKHFYISAVIISIQTKIFIFWYPSIWEFIYFKCKVIIMALHIAHLQIL